MEIIESVAAMYQNGAKRSEIAREVGISQTTVRNLMLEGLEHLEGNNVMKKVCRAAKELFDLIP